MSFNLISISQITRDLNCCISFYLGNCLFHDLVTKKIIGKGHELRGFYIFYHQVSTSTIVACFRVVSLFYAHCHLGHPSLSVLRKPGSQFHNLASLSCDSHVSLPNFIVLTPILELINGQIPPTHVHSNIWGQCPVVAKTGFWYFVTFVHNHSHMIWLILRKIILSYFLIYAISMLKFELSLVWQNHWVAMQFKMALGVED